jgi:hypothetical protein
MVGLGTESVPADRRIARDLGREATAATKRAGLEQRFEVGGLPQAALRAVHYVRMPNLSIDERDFATLQSIRAAQPATTRLSTAELKACIKEQYLLLRLDEERAVGAIPKLLPADEQARRFGLEAVRRMVARAGP